MPDISTHPSAQALAQFGHGKLSEAQAATVAAHLETCADCRQAVANLPADSFLDKVRDARTNMTVPPRDPESEALRGAVSPHVADVPPELANHSKFRIIRELGRGGMGVIYLAEHRAFEKFVALKVISPSVLDNPGALARFQAEVKAAGKLDHPNIARAHDADQAGNLHFLVMEFVEGLSLAQLLQKKGPLSVASACHCVCQTALGLQHAFEQGMAHRDIKPQNLMLTPKGQVKVLDFGLARLRGPQAAGKGLTQADAFMGTPEYVSPEQATDARTADIRADIYSLGCTLYALLTGRPPFAEDTMVKLVMAHIEKEPPPLQELRPDVPAEAAAVAAKMLAKDPAQRYQRPIEVAQALAPFAKGAKLPKGGMLSRPMSPGDRTPSAKGRESMAPNTGTVIGGETSRVVDPPAKKPAKTEREPFDDEQGTRQPQSGPQPVKDLKQERKARAPAPWWKRRMALIGGGVGGALLLLVVILWAAGVFRVKTKDGTLVLEDLPPDAEVLVDGDKVTVTWGSDGKKAEVQIKPGGHNVEVRKDGLKVQGEVVVMEDGRRKVLTVRREPPAVAAQPDTSTPQATPSDGFVPLFNGKDLTGWEENRKGNSLADWKVEDGVLIGGRQHGREARPGSRIFTKRSDYQNFRFRVETTLCEQWACCMLFLWDKSGPGHGYQAQIGASTGRDVQETAVLRRRLVGEPAGDVVGLRHLLAEPNPPVKVRDGEWFTQEVVVEGKRIRVYVNDVLRTDYEEKAVPMPGHLGIGLAGGATMRVRKIEVRELPLPTEKPKDPPAAAAVPEDKGFVPLYNGKDLTGWKTHPQQPADWRVENGVLVSRGGGGNMLFSERGNYENFHLRTEVRVNRNGNSGVFFHRDFSAKVEEGYEVDICTDQTGSLFEYPNGTLKAHKGVRNVIKDHSEWFALELIVEGDHVIVLLNSQKAVDHRLPAGYRKRGHIALQQNSSWTLAEFRKVEIKELPPTAAAKPSPVGDVLTPAQKEAFVPLFNGKDLTGWRLPGGGTGNWNVRDGMIVSSGPMSHLFTKRDDYQDFHLRAEAQINDRGNSGLYFRTAFGPGFPKGYEAQINATHQDPVKTGSLYGIANIKERLHPPNEWFTLDVIAEGDHIVILVNNNKVVDVRDTKYRKGCIALQQHDAGTVVKFRKIEIKELK